MIKNKSKYIILASSILVLVTVLLSCDTSFNTVVKDFFYSEKVTIKVDGDGLSSTDLIGYKLTKSAYDFGYCTSATAKTLTFTAAEAFSISPTITGSTKFTKGDPSKSYVVKGEQFSITVTYTPSGTTWDEATLSLSSGNEDAYKITLIGSSFKQPKNVGSSGSLRLWLRADMIKSVVAETMQIKTLPDYSGSGFDAAPITLSDSPIYTSSGINGLPSITFSTGRTLVSQSTVQNPIVNHSTYGTTTFVVFKMSSNSYSTQYILTCSNTATTTCFPGLSASYRYYDVSKGYSSSWKPCFAISGYGYGGSSRYIFNDETGDSKVLENYSIVDPYSMCMKYDETVDKATKYPNTFIYQNGKKKFISFAWNNSNSELYVDGTSTCRGAYGKPISDGEGGRYGSLGNAAVDITSGSAWNTARTTACSTRVNDWAFSYTPWITDSTTSTSTYFTNKISTTTNYNDTIEKVILGATQSTQYFSGQIAEVMVYNEALTETEIKAVNNYIY